MTLDGGGNMQASTEMLLANGDATPTNHNGTNGSIITMTLKNNHLIVETEERNVCLLCGPVVSGGFCGDPVQRES